MTDPRVDDLTDPEAERLRRDALGAAIRETAGAMVRQPGWMDPDEVTRWVNDLRSEETE